MPEEFDSEGAEVPQGGYTIPDGEYVLEIKKTKEGRSKTGNDYQVTCDLEVSFGEHKGFPVKFHRVTFIPAVKNKKAAGMGLLFLRNIGEPHSGKFKINPDAWVGKRLQAYLEANDYNGFKSMKVKWTAPVEGAQPEPIEEEVPF